MLGEVISLSTWWQRLSTRGKIVAGTLFTLPFVVAAVVYMVNSDGLEPFDPANAARSYVMVFVLIALDAVMPIFPGETTLNAAATLAAQGHLELWPIIVMGALGAMVGDSALFWIARKFSPRIQGQLTRAKANKQVKQAFELLDSSAPVLIIGGRYLPGMRFVVNATMGLSDIPYRRFLPWSVISAHPVEHLHLRAGLRDRAGPRRLPARLVHHLGPGDHGRARRGDLHGPAQQAPRRRGATPESA